MESTPGIFIKGYPYFLNKFSKDQNDILKTRLLLKRTFVLRGEKAAELFYNRDKFIRKGATPKRFQKTLFGQGGVQGLDADAHLHRKELFMKIMNKEFLEQLYQNFEDQLFTSSKEWVKKESLVLFQEIEKILCRSVCEWTGVPLGNEKEVNLRTRQLHNMISGSGAVGPRHWRGRRARTRAEKWIGGLVKKDRKKAKPGGSILSLFSHYRDLEGKLLQEKVVAVEILNLLRPVVAVARYAIFAALALHENPQYRDRLKKDKGNLDLMFVQEVRRFYPFFPFVAAKVKKDFSWNDVHFPKGRRVLLDLYATNHDERIWSNPSVFYPERFTDWNESPFNFIPQGGGDFYQGHRCAGEWISIDLTRKAIKFLSESITYIVPDQDLEIDLARIPAIPKSRFKINNVHLNF